MARVVVLQPTTLLLGGSSHGSWYVGIYVGGHVAQLSEVHDIPNKAWRTTIHEIVNHSGDDGLIRRAWHPWRGAEKLTAVASVRFPHLATVDAYGKVVYTDGVARNAIRRLLTGKRIL